MSANDPKSRSGSLADSSAIAGALVLPSALTWCYFVALADAPTALQQGVWAVGKTVQFGLPLAFVTLVAREPVSRRWRGPRGLWEGVVSGLVILALIVTVWKVLERVDPELIAKVLPNIHARIGGLGVADPLRYGALALFYSVIHTFLEEYYWRWFVFGRLCRRTSRAVAIAVSSIGFMAHHVIVLGAFAGLGSPYTWAFSLAVAVGGGYWAWLYERSGSLVAPWVSHLFVDVAIFSIGYSLLTSSGQ